MPVIEVVGAVIVALFTCTLVLLGLGLLAGKLLGLETRLVEAILIGLGITVPILEFYHLFRPIDFYVSAALALGGLAGLAMRFKYLRMSAAAALSNHRELIVALAAVACLISIRSAGPCEHFDTGLYGIQAIRWIATYPAVPGLANFYERLGFNHAFFLLVASLQATSFGSLAYRVWEGLLLMLIAAAQLRSVKAVLWDGRNRISDWFLVLLTIPVAYYVCRAEVVGTNTDLPADIMCMLAAFLFLRGLEANTESASMAQSTLFTGSVSFALAVVFKLSTAVFAGPCCLICFVKLTRLHHAVNFSRKVILACLVLISSTLLGWMCLGYVESGYPLFPSSILGLPLDWKVPRDSVRLQAAITRSFARIRTVSRSKTAGWAWIHPWFSGIRHSRAEFLIPVLLLLSGIVFASTSKKLARLANLWPLLLPCVAGLVVWFVSAPDIRFAQGEIWVLAATVAASALASWSKGKQRRTNALAALVIFVLAGLAVGPTTLWFQFYNPLFSSHPYDLFPPTPLLTRETTSGLKVIVPAVGNQWWNAPLPCTPYFSSNLELRRPPSLRSGFRPAEITESDWLPVN